MALGSIHLTPQLVQAVRDAVDILDVAGDVTRLKRTGGSRYKGLCPFHKEKTPSFSVDADNGLYYCFGCGAGGDAIKLHMQHSGDDFPAAIEALAQRYGIPLPSAPARGPGGEKRDLTQVLEAAAAFFQRELKASEFARSYLEDRRIPRELVSSFGLGYAPDGWRHLLSALQGKIPVADLAAAGLVGTSSKSGDTYDRFRHRLMFPIHAPNGRLVGFGGRTLGDDQAKYVNTSETDEFHKGRLLYGFHQAKKALRESSRALLVEGYFDVVGAVASGVGGAVAGMGTALTADQARLLGRYVDEVVIAYDGDEAGEKAFQRALPVLLQASLHVRRAKFPAGEDPDSLRLAEGPEAVRAVVENAQDAVWLEIERLTPVVRTPAANARAAQAISEVLRQVRNDVARSDYTRRAAQDLGVPENVFHKKVGSNLYYDPSRKERATDVSPAGGEEKVLHLLFENDPPPRLPHPLPPEEIFLDEDCRNIYAAFCALYRSEGGHVPAANEVLAKLSSEGGAIDRMARLLLEESDSGDGGLDEALSGLVRRWTKRRLDEVTRQIRQAEEKGDEQRLDRLLEEKTALIRRLHPEMTGRYY